MQAFPIMFVDDERNILDGLRRTLYDQFEVYTAGSGEEALQYLMSDGPFAVVISDMRMPNMDGAELLARVKVIAPDTTRMLLTGYSDVEAAVKAINDGQIFRFLSKPCPKDALVRALTDAVYQYQLVTGQRELLERTLNGAVDVLVEVLSLAAPSIFSHAHQVRACVSHLVAELKLPDPWRFEVAALLSHLGYVAVPQSILDKAEVGDSLTPDERAILEGHFDVTYKLLSNIPRLDEVAAVIRAQRRGSAEAELGDPALKAGASALRLALRLGELVRRGVPQQAAVAKLMASRAFHPEVIRALSNFTVESPETCTKLLSIAELAPGMVLEADVVTPKGIVVVPKGREVTTALIERLCNFSRGLGVVEPIRVTVHTG